MSDYMSENYQNWQVTCMSDYMNENCQKWKVTYISDNTNENNQNWIESHANMIGDKCTKSHAWGSPEVELTVANSDLITCGSQLKIQSSWKLKPHPRLKGLTIDRIMHEIRMGEGYPTPKNEGAEDGSDTI